MREGAPESATREDRTDADAPLVELDGLRVHYETGRFGPPPVRAVDGVSLDIERGETLGLVGESGCGKTTLARTLVGLETPTGGAIRVDGRPLARRTDADRRAWQREAAMVFQDPDASLDDRMTLGETVREPLDAHDWPTLALAVEGWDGPLDVRGDAVAAGDGVGDSGVATDRLAPDPDVFVRVGSAGAVADVRVRERLPLSAADLDVTRVAAEDGTLTLGVRLGPSSGRLRRERVRDLLADVGLAPEFATRYPHELSGGQRQRVAIARALALDPSLLVLDEPLTALDASVQAGVLNLLSDLQAERDLTSLLVAHDLRAVRHVCDRVAVMYLGKLMEVAPAAELFDAPANPYSRSLLSAIPDPDPTSERERITLRGSPPSARDPPEGCPFATRCPVAIRPAEFDLDADAWARIDALRGTLRERSRGSRSLADRLRRLVGLDATPDDIEALRADLFADIDLSEEARRPIDTAVERAAAGDDAAAREVLRAAFGSVCDRETPGLDPLEERDTRWSRCHRHRDAYEDVDEAVENRVGDPDEAGEY